MRVVQAALKTHLTMSEAVEKVVEKVAEVVPIKEGTSPTPPVEVVPEPIRVSRADTSSVNWGLIIGVVAVVAIVGYILYQRNKASKSVAEVK